MLKLYQIIYDQSKHACLRSIDDLHSLVAKGCHKIDGGWDIERVDVVEEKDSDQGIERTTARGQCNRCRQRNEAQKCKHDTSHLPKYKNRSFKRHE